MNSKQKKLFAKVAIVLISSLGITTSGVGINSTQALEINKEGIDTTLSSTNKDLHSSSDRKVKCIMTSGDYTIMRYSFCKAKIDDPDSVYYKWAEISN